MAQTLETLVVRLEGDIRGLRRDLDRAVNTSQQSAQRIEGSFDRIGRAARAAFAIGAGLAGGNALVRGLSSVVTEARRAENALVIFEKQVRRTGQNVDVAGATVERLSDRFGVAESVIQNAATIIFRSGGTIQQVEELLTSAGASALAAGFDVSRAFDNVATAVVTGRSELLETSGIITNLGPVLQAYARETGKTVEELEDFERIEAAVAAITAETASEVEDLPELLSGYTFEQTQLNSAVREFREELGQRLEPALVGVVSELTATVTAVNDFFDALETNEGRFQTFVNLFNRLNPFNPGDFPDEQFNLAVYGRESGPLDPSAFTVPGQGLPFGPLGLGQSRPAPAAPGGAPSAPRPETTPDPAPVYAFDGTFIGYTTTQGPPGRDLARNGGGDVLSFFGLGPESLGTDTRGSLRDRGDGGLGVLVNVQNTEELGAAIGTRVAMDNRMTPDEARAFFGVGPASLGTDTAGLLQDRGDGGLSNLLFNRAAGQRSLDLTARAARGDGGLGNLQIANNALARLALEADDAARNLNSVTATAMFAPDRRAATNAAIGELSLDLTRRAQRGDGGLSDLSFNEGAGSLALDLTRRANRGDGGLEEARDIITQSGVTFAQQVQQAGDGFIGAIESFQRGDIGGGVSGLGSTVGSIVGAFDPVTGAIITAGASILGGLFSLGGGSESAEANSAASRRSLSQLELNFTFNQTNSLGLLDDPNTTRNAYEYVDGCLRTLRGHGYEYDDSSRVGHPHERGGATAREVVPARGAGHGGRGATDYVHDQSLRA